VQLYLLHEPTSYARMLRPGARHTYHTVQRAPTPDNLHAHLAGEITIAVPLVGAAGLSYHVALDIDHGGIEALQRALSAAHARGWTAYAITSTNNEHSGGHVWMHLAQPAAPKRARLLAEQLATAASISTRGHDPAAETYPTHKALRLPFGCHTWTGKRGCLVLHNGYTIDLDSGAQAIRDAIITIAKLPQNGAARLPQLPVVPIRETARQTRQERAGAPTNLIYHYNRTTNLLALLERYGGHIAEQRRDGSAVLHCACGQHQHHDAHASLEVRPAQNTARYGQYVAIGHAPSCHFYAEHRHVIDSFTVYYRLADVSPSEALHRITPFVIAGAAVTNGGTTRTGGQP
jgi:hypothetical protein